MIPIAVLSRGTFHTPTLSSLDDVRPISPNHRLSFLGDKWRHFCHCQHHRTASWSVFPDLQPGTQPPHFECNLSNEAPISLSIHIVGNLVELAQILLILNSDPQSLYNTHLHVPTPHSLEHVFIYYMVWFNAQIRSNNHVFYRQNKEVLMSTIANRRICVSKWLPWDVWM